MVISRRAAWFLVGLAAWNVYVWVTFVRNISPDHHLDGFFLVHVAVGAISVALAGVAGALGVRALRAHRAARGDRLPGASHNVAPD
jgi:hypothetical protein